ncbi:hypothetical protein PENARI_c009G11385 [Penicillium arizonense]|uniref:Uncharacterized protein n=1 Tax=Penicillium arizonense TaxID=1835702 RepID=A0A1F5LIB4_PENAI|nr:hypothetical protein PENARI_c009G11385 [Penicillium arizonense]
MVVLYTMPYTG